MNSATALVCQWTNAGWIAGRHLAAGLLWVVWLRGAAGVEALQRALTLPQSTGMHAASLRLAVMRHLPTSFVLLSWEAMCCVTTVCHNTRHAPWCACVQGRASCWAGTTVGSAALRQRQRAAASGVGVEHLLPATA